MPPTSRGKPAKAYKVVKPKKNTKHTTASTRNHRFQSFNERIANLKIDPVRRKRHVDAEEEATEESHTHLGTALEEWRDTNLSQTFTMFAKEVAPLCDNLAMVLYNETKIMDLLATYIEKGDALAMEPLLSLLAKFAHDLDARFEQHFERTVATVTSVAAKHSDFAVIEWSFNCLAWLFKYLSRLLVPNLKPLYDLLSPYFGKSAQRPFVVRFTAEAMSFLVRKAATLYERDAKPLDTLISHMLHDLASVEEISSRELYEQGLMTLLTEAIKGIQGGIYNSGAAVLRSLFEHAGKSDDAAVYKVVEGILTSLIHHCNVGTFQPVFDCIVGYVDNMSELEPSQHIGFCSMLLFTIVSVRKGTRISNWKPLMTAVQNLVNRCGQVRELSEASRRSVLALLALAFHSATIDAVITTRKTLENVRSGQWAPHFLSFCDMLARLGPERFHEFVLPHFQTFVLEHAEDGDEGLYALIPRLARGKSSFKLKPSPRMVQSLIRSCSQIAQEDLSQTAIDQLAKANSLLASLPHLNVSENDLAILKGHLLALVNGGLNMNGGEDDNEHRRSSDFALGPAFQRLLELNDDCTTMQHLWPQLCMASPRHVGLEQFWSNVLRYLKLVKLDHLGNMDLTSLEDALVVCLSMPSHSIRQDAIDVLQKLYQMRGQAIPNLLSIIATIESVPISLDTSRTISMNIRRIAPEYATLTESDLMKRAIPTYCFGLLHIHLSQAWDDSAAALSAIANDKTGEEVVIAMAQSWLNGSSGSESDELQSPSLLDIDSDGFKVFSDFECPNLAKMTAIRNQVFEDHMSGMASPTEQLFHDLKRVPLIAPTARNQALRVLSKIPNVAEKRSRLLVPVLLRWAGAQDDYDEKSPKTERWTRKDQKAMLAIFAQFVNPRVLYKSKEVHHALLSLSANGDVEIQRSALKAILAWKDGAVTRYEEHLMNLLDEARFREELSVFLRDEVDDEDAIRQEDHVKLMPVLLRLLYGRAIAGGKEGQSGRRKAIFVALARFGDSALGHFLDIGLSTVDDQTSSDRANLQPPKTTLRQQFGMLNMVNDMLQVLGSELEPFASKLMNSILSCAIFASQKLDQEGGVDKDVSLLRSVRQVAIQCLVKIYTSRNPVVLTTYGSTIVENLVKPRLETFVVENAHSISGLLRLLAAWSEHSTSATLLLGEDGEILESVAQLLEGQHTKGEVRLFILQDIVERLIQEDTDASILQPHVSSFVKATGSVIEQQPSKEILDACVRCFSRLAGRITSRDEAANVTKICTELLTKPSKAVSPSTKADLLRTLLPLIHQFGVSSKDELYAAISALFSRLQETESRLLLSQVLQPLVKHDAWLSEVAKICEDMNAMGSRLDEADHDRRERAFAWIYDSSQSLTWEQWQPIVHNCLHFIRDPEDRVNRSSASHALQLFVDAAAKASEPTMWNSLMDDAVLDGIERGMRDTSELVRAEYLQVLGHIVEQLPMWQRVSGLKTLAVGGDDEASFFSNALHIQQHRRLRALRRLAEEATNLASNHVSRIFLPLLEHFVFDQVEGDSGRTLADQTVLTIGSLAKVLNRSAFRATFQRYISYLKSKAELEKTVLRLLGAMVDGMKDSPVGDQRSGRTIIDDYLPPLLEYLHQKDESTVDRRMPVAVTIVKLMLALPESELIARLPAVLTDVCHVLRSRAQEARDQTRKALASISALVGHRFFSFILKELRSALKRGYQLHVLSFTVHTLLVDGNFTPGDLDECLHDLMLVIMDDIFGVTGQEKDAEEYKSGMKEVKSSKSFDTMELLARITPVHKLGELVHPIRSLLSEKLDMKTVKKIDDLLTRLRKGLDQNPAFDSREMLAFCWEIVSQVYAEESAFPAAEAEVDERAKRYLIQPEEPKKSKSKGATTSYRFKLISFALNLLRKVVRRHEDLQTPQNMAGFLPMAGDALIQGQEEVKLSAARLLSTIMRVPLPQLAVNALVYVKEAVAMIQGAPNMTTDPVKAALELITSVLREKRSVPIRERDIAFTLKRIRTDIDEPDRQGIIYKFLRAVLGRKIVITELYETMDEVGKAMVTSPDRTIRESARSSYLQFVMEFPQGKDRWQKQTSFLVGNLQYDHAAGRQSVMEFLNLMIGKIDADILTDISPRIFVSLLPVLISDSDSSCRDMARLLVGKLFDNAGDALLAQSLALMDTWLKKEKKSTIKAGALQCWAILLRTRELPQKRLEALRGKLEDIISESAEGNGTLEPQLIQDALKTFAALVETNPKIGFARASVDLWRAVQRIPSDDAQVQESVAALLGTFFTDVASASSKTSDGLSGLPLRGCGGLEIGAEDMRRLCAVNLKALRAISLGTSESLSTQIVRNLIFLGRCFAANEMPSNEQNDEGFEADEDEEEDAEQSDSAESSAFANLIRRLSSMLMADKFSIVARTATLQTIAALINQLPALPDLQTVMRPLYALTDPTVPKPPGELHKALEDKAAETLELIQKKIGSEAYVTALAETRSKAKERRDERRRKRRIEAVSEPERWARDKKKKYEGKKLKQKAKGMEARGKRRGW